MHPDTDINRKLSELVSDSVLKSGLPTMPVDLALQEAEDLLLRGRNDFDALTKAGLSPELWSDLPLRIATLNFIEQRWTREYLNYRDNQLKWKKHLLTARKLRTELFHTYRYAFKDLPHLIEYLRRIHKGNSHADLIRDLQNLAALVDTYPAELRAAGMDFRLPQKALATANEASKLLPLVTIEALRTNPILLLRNKAFFHLQEAVKEIRKTARYAFTSDTRRLTGYYSAFLQNKNRKSRNKSIKTT